MAVLIIFGSTDLNRPKIAQATGIPVIETNPELLLEAIKSILTEINTYKTQINTYKNELNTFKNEINTYSSLIQQYLEWDFFKNNENEKWQTFKMRQDDILNAIKEKFDKNGGVMFIQDHIDYLSSPGAETAKTFSSELDKNFLCESFNDQIKSMFKPDQAVAFSEAGPGGAGCTIQDTVGDINAFYDDFSQGGWDAFTALMEPQNNIFGATMIVEQELKYRQSLAYDAAKTEDLANQGFLSNRGECLEQDDAGNCIKRNIGEFPGVVYADTVGKVSSAELDFIANSGDLTSYTQDIGNTFLDRMFDEIVKLTGDMKDSASSKKPPAPGSDPCAFLKAFTQYPNLYNSCVAANSSKNLSFAGMEKFGEQLLNKVISDEDQALGNYHTLGDTGGWLDQLIGYLTTLAACSKPPSDVQSRLLDANTNKNFVTTEISRLTTAIDQLSTELDNLKLITDQTSLIAKIQELQNKYNINDAANDNTTASDMIKSINDAINQAKTDLANPAYCP